MHDIRGLVCTLKSSAGLNIHELRGAGSGHYVHKEQTDFFGGEILVLVRAAAQTYRKSLNRPATQPYGLRPEAAPTPPEEIQSSPNPCEMRLTACFGCAAGDRRGCSQLPFS